MLRRFRGNVNYKVSQCRLGIYSVLRWLNEVLCHSFHLFVRLAFAAASCFIFLLLAWKYLCVANVYRKLVTWNVFFICCEMKFQFSVAENGSKK
jgi:hypothetical protein